MTRIDQNAGKNPSPDSDWVEISPHRGWLDLGLAELWRARELLWRFAQRGLKLRYRQTLLGVAWVVLQPLLASGVLALVFGELAGLGDGARPYVLTVYAALLPWNLFSQGVQRGGLILVSDRNLVTKTWLPRMALPLSSILAVSVDLLVATLFYFAVAGALSVAPTLAALAVLPLCLPLLCLTAGVTLLVAGLNVHYRDVRHTVPFLMQLAFFATPIAYPLSRVPPTWEPWLALNPLVGQTEAFRWALLGQGQPFPWSVWWPSCLGGLLCLIGGLVFFRRVERSLADVI